MKTKYVTIITSLLFFALFSACGDKKSNEQQVQVSATGFAEIDEVTAEIATSPEDASLYAKRATLYYNKEGYDEAIADMHKAIALDSMNAPYYHRLADIYLDYFKSHLAIRTLERAVELFPERIPTLLKLSEFQLITKMYPESMKTIDRILKIDPQNAEAYFMFGMNFKESGDTARAINSFQSAVELDPDLIDAWITLGKLQADQGNKIAARYFDNAVTIAPDNPIAIHAKADYLRDQNDLEGAIELYKKIAVIDPQYETGYYNAGLLYMELDSVEQAYQQFDLTIKASPLHIRAYYYRGLAAEYMGNIEQAKSDYQQALKLAPGYERAEQALFRLEEKETI